MTQRAIDGSYVYFVTTNTTYREKFFVSEEQVLVLSRIVRNACRLKNFDLLGYCILPDHVHLLVYNKNKSQRGFRNPRCDDSKTYTLSALMHSIKRNFSRQMNVGRIWQPRFNFRIIDDQERFNTAIEYMQHNSEKHEYGDQYANQPFIYINWLAIQKIFEN